MAVTQRMVTQEEISTRVRLYDFSRGKQTFFQWQAGIIPDIEGKRILELGCGTGRLWQDLAPRAKGSDAMLTDLSETLLAEAELQLADVSSSLNSLSFQRLDFNVDTLPSGMDVIIANHNLFYANSLSEVLKKISGALNEGGVLICSTVGKDHLHQLLSVLRSMEPSLPWAAEQWASVFGLENGGHELLNYFSHVDLFEYDNNLHVRSLDFVMDYLRKTLKGELAPWVDEHEALLRDNLTLQFTDKGYLRLTPNSGIFIAYK